MESVRKEYEHLTFHPRNYHMKKDQVIKLGEIISKETDLSIQFDGPIDKYGLKFIHDKQNNPIDLYEFFDNYDKEEEWVDIIKSKQFDDDEIDLDSLVEMMNESVNEEEDENDDDSNDSDNEEVEEEEVSDEDDEQQQMEIEISETIVNQQQKQLQQIIRTKEHMRLQSDQGRYFYTVRLLNNCLLYYLKTECTGYSFVRERKTFINDFLYLDKILRGNKELFNVEKIKKQFEASNPTQKSPNYKEEQLQCLSEIIEQESSMKIHFNSKGKDIIFDYFVEDSCSIISDKHCNCSSL